MARVHDWSLLEADLRRRLGNAVRFDEAHRATYSADASLYRQVPIGVVVPRSMEDFIAGVKICRQHEAPILIRGGGTSMSGQTVNVAVVFDLSAFCNQILELNQIGRATCRERVCKYV